MFCIRCGTENSEVSRFCRSCGRAIPTQQPVMEQIPPGPTRGNAPSGVTTATLIVGLFAAAMLFLGGCSAAFSGTLFQGIEESFGIEESSEGGSSTTADVANGGVFAVVIAVVLAVGAGLAKAALKTSLVTLIIVVLLLILLVSIDTTSLFALFYYLAIPLVGTGVILMLIAHFRAKSRNNSST